jgi:K319L-like, PKD domain
LKDDDGRSFNMKGFEQTRKVFQVAGVVLLLMVAMGASMFAQSLNPVPFPTPVAVPPPAIQVPALQTRPAGVLLAGQIQYASLDATPGLCNKDDNPAPTPDNPPLPAGCKHTGGWIQVNDELIRVPSGTIVVFPNTFLTWEETFEFNPNTHQTDAVFQSGLAMADTLRFPGTYQATIDFNIVNGQRIAGIVRIAQDAAAGFSGYIESIDYPNGILIVNGQRVQINDPKITFNVPNPDGSPTGVVLTKGRYTAGQSADPRMTVDQGNTTVRTATGFNMCIPVVAPGTYNNELGIPGVPDPYVLVAPPGLTFTGMDDPQCPEINRPRDIQGLGMLTIFTMNGPGDPPSPENPFPQDPYAEAPFEVGDWVDVIATQEVDATGPYMTATEVVGNVSIFTAPGIDPAYVVVEVTIMGTAATPDPAFPQEAGVRTRVEGMTSDPTRAVDVSAIDYDCNGNVTFREPSWVANFPVEPGPPGLGKRGRWRVRFPQGGIFMPPTQNIGARVSGGVLGKNKSGSDFNEYQLPTGEFIYPELLVPGNPPPPFNFNDFQYLTNGSGPLPLLGSVFDSTQIQLGLAPLPFYPNQNTPQLNPFPYDIVPPLTCTAGTFTSVARPTFSSTPNPPFAGITVTLDGTTSTPPTGPFVWSQIVNPGDPVVTINNPNSAKATFLAPTVASSQNLTFQLIVGGDGFTPASAPATVIVPIIVPPAGTPPALTASSSPANPVASGAAVTLTAVGVDPAGGALTFVWTPPAGIVLTPLAADGSVQTFTAPIVPELTSPQTFTFSVTATSAASGLSATTTVTVVVNPQTDIVLITGAAYRVKKARLDVTATDFTPGVTLTVTLDIINQSTGQPISAVMGPAIPGGPGLFDVIIANVPPPNLITITSSGGGVTTSGITVLR